MMKNDDPEQIVRGDREESLSVEVTTRCNSACKHCFVRPAISECTDLPIDVIKEIIHEGYNLGYRYLHLTGGEPLIYGGLFEALDCALTAGYKKILMNSNGTLLTDSTTNRLSNYGGLAISVSLEGPEALNDRVRGRGSYRRTALGIGRALEAGIDLFIYTTVSKSLLSVLPQHVIDLSNKFPDIKCSTLIQLIRPTKDAFALTGELLEPDDFLKLIRMVSILNLSGYRVELLNNPLGVVAAKLLGLYNIPDSKPLCRDEHLIVMADEDICLSHSRRTSFGKFKGGMLERILTSDDFLKAVRPDETTCPTCRFWDLCKESGMIHPFQSYWDGCGWVPFCERVLDIAAG